MKKNVGVLAAVALGLILTSGGCPRSQVKPPNQTAQSVTAPAASAPTADLQWDGKETVAAYAGRANLKDTELTLDLGDSVNMKLALIPGSNWMREYPSKLRPPPANYAVSGSAFYMSIYPVTQQQYKQVMGENPSHFTNLASPVECVSLYDAEGFCARLSTKTGKNITLPAEAQWEWACRAGSKAAYPSGQTAQGMTDYACCNRKWEDGTCPVGQRRPNAWGLFDMLGNVEHWCSDAPSDPSGWVCYEGYPVGGMREGEPCHVARGAWWCATAVNCSFQKGWVEPDRYTNPVCGFRVIVTFAHPADNVSPAHQPSAGAPCMRK
jgi:formylglycine-generating enzyme required for sulfatase activity